MNFRYFSLDVLIFSAVHEMSRTFEFLTPKASTLHGGVGVNFSGQFMTFPGLLNF